MSAPVAGNVELPLFSFHIGRLTNMSGCPWGFWFMWRPRPPENYSGKPSYWTPLKSPFGFCVSFHRPVYVTPMGNTQ